jgi:malate synthase
MSAYSQLVIQRCHKRCIHAMAAQIPIKKWQAATIAFNKVIADKEREGKMVMMAPWRIRFSSACHERVWPTHAYQNQIHVKREDIKCDGTGLTRNPKGTITVEGFENISISVLYLASWLNGQGAAALHNLMEDAATAEISRSQLWRLQNKVILDNGIK